MRIALIDVDGHNFPNLPLMKLSAWHKNQGYTVDWYDPLTAKRNERKKEMAILNYTTTVDSYKTVSEIEHILVKHNAKSIMKNYDGESITGLSFLIDTGVQQIPVRLPVKNELLMKKEIFSNVFVIVLTAIFILCANFAYYDMTKKIYFELMFIVLIAMGIYEIIDGIKNKNQVYLGVRMNGWIILCGAMLIISAFIFAAYFVW